MKNLLVVCLVILLGGCSSSNPKELHQGKRNQTVSVQDQVNEIARLIQPIGNNDFDPMIARWNMETGEFTPFSVRNEEMGKKTLETNYNINHVCYDPTMDRLILGFDDEIQLGYLDMKGIV